MRAEIVTIECSIWPHPPRQQTPAECAISERRDVVCAAIGQDISLDLALEQIIGRLQHMQRRDAAEFLHLADRKVADADGADLSLPEQRMHCLSGFFDRY